MQTRDYRRFDAELGFLQALPGVEVHLHDYFIELPLLAQLFGQLSRQPAFARRRWLIFSRQHDAGLIRSRLDADTVLFYIANEDGTLPDFAADVGAVFTPDLPPQRLNARRHVIPLGCSGDVPEPAWIPFAERGLDVFFSGQVLPQRGPFIRQAIQLLFDLQPQLERQAEILLTPRFRSGLAPEAYARKLMDSRIALIPPGFSPITLRMFEAMRSGCVLFANRLPPFWYLDGLPRVEMPPDWYGLGQTVLALLADGERLAAMHAATRAHYFSHCTPAAIAAYVWASLAAL